MKLPYPVLPRFSDWTRLDFRLLWVAIASFTTLWAGSAASAEESAPSLQISRPGPTELAVFDGRWTRIADDEAEAARLTTIDVAIEDLSWIVRRMAGGVIKRTTTPPPEVSFAWDGERLHQLVSDSKGERRRLVRLGGAPETLFDPYGGDFSSHWTWTETGLELHWAQHQAHGSNLYRVDDRDQTLLIEHRIQITGISGVDPIVYRARFGRTELPAVAAASDQSGSDAVARSRR